MENFQKIDFKCQKENTKFICKISIKVYLLKYEQLKLDIDRIKQIYIHYITIVLFAYFRLVSWNMNQNYLTNKYSIYIYI